MRYTILFICSTILSRPLKTVWNYLLIFGLILPFISNAQSYDDEIKQLQQSIAIIQVNNVQKVDLLNELSYAYRRNAPNQMDSIARQALFIAKKIDYKKGESIALKNIGTGLLKTGGSLDSIITYYTESLNIATDLSDYYTQAACLNNLGLVYTQKIEYTKALQVFQQALAIHKKHLPQDRLRLLLIGNMGEVFMEMKDYENANKYLEESIEKAEKARLTKVLMIFMDEYVFVQQRLGQIEPAIERLKYYLPQTKELGDYHSFVSASIILTNLLLEQKKYAEANQYIKEALVIAEQTNFQFGYCELLSNQSIIALSNTDYFQANQYAEMAYECANDMNNDIQLLKATRQLIQIAITQKNTAKINVLLSTYKSLLHKNYNIEQKKIQARIEAEYQNKRKQSENTLLKAQQIKNESIIRLQNTILISLITIAGLVIAFSTYLYRIRQYQNTSLEKDVKERTAALHDANIKLELSNQHLSQSNTELEQFAYIASHDLKQPLNTVLNFSQLLDKKLKTNSNPKIQTYLRFIKQGAKQMKVLIDDILAYAKLNQETTEPQNIDLNELITELIHTLHHIINDKQAEIIVKSELPIIVYDYSKIKLVFQNLIENALKYNQSESPLVEISAEEKKESFIIHFADNGIGIDAMYFPKLFKMFSRLENGKDYEGTGLGLSLCKKVMTTMGGDISIKSETNMGSIFSITLPKTVIANLEVTI